MNVQSKSPGIGFHPRATGILGMEPAAPISRRMALIGSGLVSRRCEWPEGCDTRIEKGLPPQEQNVMSIPINKPLAVAAIAVAGGVLPTLAGISQVTSPSNLLANSTVSIGSLGSSGTIIASGSTATTSSGTSVTFTSTTSLFSMEQGVNWSGNFSYGDDLLYSWGNTSITIDPSQLVQGAGLQIQSSSLGTYYAQLSAVDSSGITLGSVTGTGSSTTAGDGSALYLGLLSNAYDIDKLVVQLLSPTPKLGKFSIGNIGLVEGAYGVAASGSSGGGVNSPSAVPESTSAGFLGGVSLVILGMWKRARSRQD